MHNDNILLHNNRVKFTFRIEYIVKVGTFLFLLLLFASWASAQNVNVPDANFKAVLVADNSINTNNDTEIQVSEATAYTGAINVTSKNITDLTGIEAFVNLTELICTNNPLTVSLDVSKNIALTKLVCIKNQLTGIDVTKNSALKHLNTSYNPLTSLDVTQNTALTYLRHDGEWGKDGLTTLDLTKNTALAELEIKYHQLINLDLSKNTALTDVRCSSNQLTSLDLGTGNQLKFLDCRSNKITALDLSKKTALKQLNCSSNSLTSLDISPNTSLAYLTCGSNSFTTLDLSANVALVELDCFRLPLTDLDVSKNTALTYLRFGDGNQFNTIDLSKNIALTQLIFSYSQFTSLDLSKNQALTYLNCNNNALTDLDLSTNTKLKTVYCKDNTLTNLNLGSNTILTHLYCGNNQLSSLDVSANTALTYLDVQNNKLTDLDVSTNAGLEHLYCNANKITSLDVSANTTLKNLYCDENQLTRLDLSSNTALATLECQDNQLITLDLRNGNPPAYLNNRINMQSNLLNCILVDDVAADRSLWKKDDQATYCSDQSLSVGIVSGRRATNLSPFPVRIIFTDAVTGFDMTDLEVTNATLDNLQTSDHTEFTLDVTPLSEGTVTLNLAADKVTDGAGNPNSAAFPFSIEYETIVPTVEIDNPATGSGYVSWFPARLSIIFSEEMVGFTLDDLSIVNATASNLETSDNKTFKIKVNPIKQGEVTINIEAGKATDLAGNPNTAAIGINFIFDTVKPSAMIASSLGNSTNQSPISVSITFDEEIQIETEDEARQAEAGVLSLIDKLDLTNASADNLQTTDNRVFTIDVTPDSEGVFMVDLAAEKVSDLAYNPNVSSSQLKMLYDITAPTCTISSVQGSKTTEPSFPVNIAFSETVTGFELSDLSLVNAEAANLKSSDNKTFTFDLTPSSTGKVTIDVAANKVKDQAGNGNMVATQFSIMYDAILRLDDKQLNLRVYPNPVTNQLFIQTYRPHGASPTQFTLTDIRGKQILSKEIKPDANGVIAIDMKVYPIGLYFLNMMSEDGLIVRKVSKQ